MNTVAEGLYPPYQDLERDPRRTRNSILLSKFRARGCHGPFHQRYWLDVLYLWTAGWRSCSLPIHRDPDGSQFQR